MNYSTIKQFVENHGHSSMYENGGGDMVIIRHFADNNGKRFEVTTYYDNGAELLVVLWEDGTVEEIHK